MPPKNKGKARVRRKDGNDYTFGLFHVRTHPIFRSLLYRASIITESNLCPQDGWAVVRTDGEIHINESRLGAPGEWEYVFAHCLLHLAFGHFRFYEKATLREWNAACDCIIARFLHDLKLWQPPLELKGLLDDLGGSLPLRSEERLYEHFCERGIPEELFPTGTAGQTAIDMLYVSVEKDDVVDWQKHFSKGLVNAVAEVVEDVSGQESTVETAKNTAAYRARNWFITNYPLLGALASTFKIIEDPLLCHRMDIKVAAVHPEMREIYMNPHAHLDEEELLFVMAHELLHVGLRHDVRCAGRDPYLWNVACDYVINSWLIEMGVGKMPQIGGLYDPELKGESAESIYDRISTDLRRYRKLMTLRGIDIGDILGEPGWWVSGEGAQLDDFYRSALSQGLALHQELGRGYLAAGLIEEIRALAQPPIPWDVELAQWFDHYFPPIEDIRTYARASRRQSATPDIPRPSRVKDLERQKSRTFGVLLDTSGSMDRVLLAKALGAIASYSIARDVPLVRVVFCDAVVYDQGYMSPEDIAGSVKVRGRGGTILQPGVNLLERSPDFPKDGPLLIITDGMCDRLQITHEHAFLLPFNRSLPFPPRGKVFRIKV